MSTKTSSIGTGQLTIGLAQIAPIWLDREATIAKILTFVADAANRHCDLVVFGEAIVPGYPFWLEHTDGARFNSPVQKKFHAHYLDQAVHIESGHLRPLCEIARDKHIAIIVGCMERAQDRGGHSVYCSLVYIDQRGEIQTIHRKLMPTYDERLVWAQGDGHGLRVHPLGAFTVGGLNCWENWMPLVRSALYAQGEDLHIAIWPGSLRNTEDITRMIAKESRSFVVSVSGLMRKEDISQDIPHADTLIANGPETFTDGGSCLAGPDGAWVISPVIKEETLLVATIDHQMVREERQNFDPSGHYSRPDVTHLSVNRKRQTVLSILE